MIPDWWPGRNFVGRLARQPQHAHGNTSRKISLKCGPGKNSITSMLPQCAMLRVENPEQWENESPAARVSF